MAAAGTRVQLCGRLVVRLAGRRVEGDLPGRQGRLAFAFLAAHRHRLVPRSELAAALWQDSPPPSADASLTAVLSKLRRALGRHHIDGRSTLQLVLEPAAIVDVEAAAEAIHRAEAAVHRADFLSAWAPARIALHTAARGFLPGLEAPWVDERCRDLDDRQLRALESVAHAGIGLGGAELDAALRSGRALIATSPYRESGHRLLMEGLAAHGDVAEALLVYDRLRTSVRDDLGTTASRETAEVHRRLLARSP